MSQVEDVPCQQSVAVVVGVAAVAVVVVVAAVAVALPHQQVVKQQTCKTAGQPATKLKTLCHPLCI